MTTVSPGMLMPNKKSTVPQSQIPFYCLTIYMWTIDLCFMHLIQSLIFNKSRPTDCLQVFM